MDPDDENATIYNSSKKAYKEDNTFRDQCDELKLKMIYKHQQKEYKKLME